MIQPPLVRISVRDLAVFGFHGVLPEEKRLGQRFVVSVDAMVDVAKAVQRDDYQQAVCYGQLCRIAHEILTGLSLNLIETVAARIADAVLEQCEQVHEVRVEVRKPSAPLPHTLREAVVEVVRHRHYPVGFSLGANMGDREATLTAAVDALARHEGVTVRAVSSLYDSTPWGVEDQPPFVNLCVIGETMLRPHDMLTVCKQIEQALGRMAGPRWGERNVDIDLLFHGEGVSGDKADSVLILPHRHMFERAFVLEPLVEIAPDLEISGRRVAEVLARLARKPGDAVRRADRNGP